MTVIGVRTYPDGAYDLVEVPWREAHLAYCADCGLADCPRWLGDHKSATQHEHVYFVRAQRQLATDAKPTRSRAATPPIPSYDGPLTCFFGTAHLAPGLKGTVRCTNCGSLVEAAVA